MKFSPQRLRAAREAVGLSRDEVARRVHRHGGTITNYERGAVTPSLAVLADLAELYGVPVDDLFNPDDPTDAVTAFQAELDALIAKAPPLTAEQKTQLRALLRGVA